MERRDLMKFGLGNALLALIGGCGGNDSASEVNDFDEYKVGIVEEGINEAELASLPSELLVHKQEFSRIMPFSLSAQVFCGNEPQAGALVTFYDIDARVLATATTDSQGNCNPNVAAKSLVFVTAKTQYGDLLGVRVFSDLAPVDGIEVNIYQTLAVKLYAELGVAWNVLNYILQKYFAIGYTEEIWEIGRGHQSLSQEKMFQAMLASKGLSNFIEQLIADVKYQVNNDGHSNSSFIPDEAAFPGLGLQSVQVSSRALLQKTSVLGDRADENEWEYVDSALTVAEKLIGGMAQFPYGSEVVKFLFSQFRGQIKPGDKDPFAEINEFLREIKGRLDSIQDFLRGMELSKHISEMESYWNIFVSAERSLIDLNKQISESVDDGVKAVLQLKVDEYVSLLLKPETKAQLDSAHGKFFCSENVSLNNSVLAVICKYLESKKFYSTDGQAIYQACLAHFVTNQSRGYRLIAAAAIEDSYQKNNTESQASALVAYYSNQAARSLKMAKAVRVDKMPSRVFIHHEKGLAWVGSCNDIQPWQKFIRNDTWCQMDKKYAKGLGSSQGGPAINEGMLYSNSNKNGVSLAACNYAKWRMPSQQELRDSFFDEAKKQKMKLDAYAYENGISKDVPFRRVGDKKLVKVVASRTLTNPAKNQRTLALQLFCAKR